MKNNLIQKGANPGYVRDNNACWSEKFMFEFRYSGVIMPEYNTFIRISNAKD